MLDASGVRLRSVDVKGIGLLSANYDLPWNQVVRVQQIVGMGFMPLLGVRFVTRDPNLVLVFWTLRQARILDLVRSHGAEVDPVPQRLKAWL